ncbi:MAG: DUF1998 domain-containing protein [Pseudonocardia sp.]|nr:DUF1998 domain-containing protein [Pseudonocardia sp.]
MVYDRLPGGTGYLHRLLDPAAFRATLEDARRALLACRCQDDGRRACHRCLHRHTEERFQDVVSRRAALEILAELLGPVDEHGELLDDRWQVTDLAYTGQIGLDRQVESDLEARFLAGLRTWIADDPAAAFDEDGHDSGYLRFTDTTGAVRWWLTAQQEHGRTRSDFTFRRIDGPAETVTVYLDGHRNHATRDRNTLAADAEKRGRLRADGHTVFQITWDDLDLLDKQRSGAVEPVWPPYQRTAQLNAAETYAQLGSERGRLADAVFTNPITTMLAYLRNPDGTEWARRVVAAIAGLTPSAAPVATAVDRAGAQRGVQSALTGTAAGRPGSGAIHVLRATDDSGLPLVLAIDATRGTAPADIAWSALAVLDDTDGVLDTPEHTRRWRA